MARLLFVLPRFHTNFWVATRAMLGAGHEVTIFANGASGGEDHTLVRPAIFGRYPSRIEVEAAVRHARPDMIFLRNAWALSRRAARAGRRRGLPMMLYNQDPLDKITTLTRRLELRWKGLPVNRFTPVRGRDPRAPPDPWATILPLPVARLPVEAPAPRHADRLNLLCVAKLGLARKNQPRLIETLAAAGLGDRVHLTLIGAAPAKDAAAQRHGARIQALALRDWITLVGHVPFAQIPRHYAGADVCILPSFGELRGTAPLEAMAYGVVPVISADCGAAGDLSDGVNGFVVDMRRPETLVARLRALLDSPSLLSRLKAAARRTAETELSERRFLAGLDTILARHGLGPTEAGGR